MTTPEDAPEPDDGEDESREPPPDDAPQTEEVHHAPVGALVPEKVAAGVFATGLVVLQGPHEFVLDFVQRLSKPQQVAARVVLPATVVPSFTRALSENIARYRQNFGASGNPPAARSEPPARPPASNDPPVEGVAATDEAGAAQRQSPAEVYEQLKLRDDVLSGAYANAVMISHTASEFVLDFITTFFPRSAVSCRVFLAAPNVPRVLNSLQQSYAQFERRRGGDAP